VKKAVSKRHSAGQFANTGVYGAAWAKALPAMHKPSNAHMWKDSQIKWGQCMLTMKARWGQMWTRKMAFRFGLASSPNCPLCGEPDSAGHLLGGCSHPEAVAMKISRHDSSVKLVQKAIALSPLGGYYTIMDAGAEKDLPKDVHGKRLPAWLLPPVDASLTEAERAEQELTRKKLRPDILVIEGLSASDTTGPAEAVRSHIASRLKQLTVHVIEVGYTSDIDHEGKSDVKTAQHEALVAELKKAGFEVKYHEPFTLGRCGSIPASLINTFKKAFKMSTHRAEEYANKLTRHAVHWVDKMYTHRMCLEASGGSGAPGQQQRKTSRCGGDPG
jgi:hypothetical protein